MGSNDKKARTYEGNKKCIIGYIIVEMTNIYSKSHMQYTMQIKNLGKQLKLCVW